MSRGPYDENTNSLPIMVLNPHTRDRSQEYLIRLILVYLDAYSDYFLEQNWLVGQTIRALSLRNILDYISMLFFTVLDVSRKGQVSFY